MPRFSPGRGACTGGHAPAAAPGLRHRRLWHRRAPPSPDVTTDRGADDLPAADLPADLGAPDVTNVLLEDIPDASAPDVTDASPVDAPDADPDVTDA